MERPDTTCNADFKWNTEILGLWLRWLRTDRGYSIGKLAAVSGVNQSEIHRVETGQTECRISTLLMLCAALGASAGWILDRVLFSDASEYTTRIERDPDFTPLMKRLGAPNESVESIIAANMACACVLASILLRSSTPQSRVKEVVFPQPEWQSLFAKFADKIALLDQTIDRANILESLLSFPVRELSNQGILPESVLRDEAASFAGHKKNRRQFMWMPLPSQVSFPKPLRLS